MKKSITNETSNASQGASTSVPQATSNCNTSNDLKDNYKAFDSLKRTFEQAYTSGNDYSDALTELSTVIAKACINKCIDPQRKTAQERDTASSNGCNPALVDLKYGISHDRRILDNTRCNADAATNVTLNSNGDCITTIADDNANDALTDLISETLTDGIDLVQTAAVALIGQAVDHANCDNWLDSKYTVRRLSKRVYIGADDSAAYRDDETTPIQEVYREVRRAIQDSRAVQTDPRNGYTYIEDLTADGLDTIYHRMQRYADLGGETRDGLYTADIGTYRDYNDVMDALKLTDRQLTIVNLRMRGYGYKAIAAYLGVRYQAIDITLKRIQAKCEAIGFTPSMWREMTDND